MEKKEVFIIRLNLADLISLSALFFSSFALVQIFAKNFYFAISLLFIGMFADNFDGMIARKLNIESEFGRYLDGFIDLIGYLIAPVLFLYVLGNKDPLSLIIFFIFITSGILRLSKFNIIGNLKEGSKLYYTGLPVFWSLFLLLFLFGLSFITKHLVFITISNLLLITFSFFMILNKPFFKPQKYILITIILVVIILAFFYLHLKFE